MKYLPVGNDFISLPRINEQSGAIEDITFLYMAAKGLIDIRGNSQMPLIQPFVHLEQNNTESPLPEVLNWSRLANWLPNLICERDKLQISITYLPPIDERGFAVQINVNNTASLEQSVELGLEGCWASSWHCVNEDKPLSGIAKCFQSNWNNSLVFEYTNGFPMFAFAPMANVTTLNTFKQDNNGSISYRLCHSTCIAPKSEKSIVFYWGLGFEEVSAATSAKEMLRQAYAVELTKTIKWLQKRSVHFANSKLTQLYNTNLFFCYFFSAGITLDTEELVLVTSRSPRYYVSAAYWDRDSLLWSFPAILDIDPVRAKQMLNYVYTKQQRNFGIHSRYIDGTVLELGFELDELVAPLLALTRYVKQTNDYAFLGESHIQQGIDHILNKLAQHKANKYYLYDTFLQPTDDERVYPFITYDNVLVWKALKDLSSLSDKYKGLNTLATKIKNDIVNNCIKQSENGQPYFCWSTDLNGKHDIYDEPPGSLQLLPLLGFCKADDAVYVNTVNLIRSPEYKYSFANNPINEIGCPHAPHPWILSLANSILCGRLEHSLSILEKLHMDNGIACESVDEITGYCTTGEAFATCAGFLCHAIYSMFK